jgi:hypothetical protein
MVAGAIRTNLPDPGDYEKKLAGMSASELVELGLNEIHEVACALYIKHTYILGVVDSFVGGEYFGEDMSNVLKDRMGQAVKELQKLSAASMAAIGNISSPFNGKDSKKRNAGRDLAGRHHY